MLKICRILSVEKIILVDTKAFVGVLIIKNGVLKLM